MWVTTRIYFLVFRRSKKRKDLHNGSTCLPKSLNASCQSKTLFWRVYSLKNANDECIKCRKMECLEIIPPGSYFRIVLFAKIKLFNACSKPWLMIDKNINYMKKRSKNVIFSREPVIKYNFDISTQITNGHFNQQVVFQKPGSGHLFCHSLSCCRWDLGYPGLLPLMLLLPHLPQC